MHPQPVAGERQAVRWVSDVDLPVGRVLSAPGTVGPLLEYGVLTAMFVERGGVWTWLSPERTWVEHGPRIRGALAASLDVDGWRIEEGSAQLLELVARDVLEGDLASYVASHGGHITVVSASRDEVVLDFGGACEDCPASGVTLHEKIETAIRSRYPGLRRVTRTTTEPSLGWLGIPVPGRGR